MLQRNIFAAMQYLVWLGLLAARTSGAAPLPPSCPVGAAKRVEDARPLALLVGVGPTGSAEATAMARQLGERYGVPSRNLCLLTGEAATRETFERAWADALVARAQPGDPVLVYLSAPGSQLPDDDGDEPDEWDETLVLAGDRANNELGDDAFQALLDRLVPKTDRVGVVVEASFSGCTTETARCVPPARALRQPDSHRVGDGDGAPGWAVPTGLLVETRPAEGRAPDTSGVLTRALLASDWSEPVSTFRPRLDQRVGAESDQISRIHGAGPSLFAVAPKSTPPPVRPTIPPTGRAWLRLEGQSETLPNQRSLAVEVVPASETAAPCQRGAFVPAAPGEEQPLPLCLRWRLVVRASSEGTAALRVSGVLVTGDGAVLPLDDAGRARVLQPGESWELPRAYVAVPPVGVRDHVLVFGTTDLEGPLPWEDAQTRAPWTSTYLALRVDDDPALGHSTRETTLADFDVRPYLPKDPNSSLSAVLRLADELQRRHAADGVGYQQHDWTQATDDANLALGIDCSRAIWYAFTRAGLRYNRDDRYLWTGAMVGASSPMREQFTDCSADPNLKTGDLLVYLDRARGEGHVVMVIDPAHRIAWGSHNTDGNTYVSETQDTGVEYQIIKYRDDWAKWDRPTMSRVACWRYAGFTDEPAATRGGAPECGASCGLE